MSGKLFNNNLLVRSLSAVVFVAVVVGATLVSQWTFGAMVVAIAAGCALETYKLAARCGARPLRGVGVAMCVVLVAAAFALNAFTDEYLAGALLVALALLCAYTLIAELYRRQENPIVNVAVTFFGVAYAGIPLAALAFLPFLGGGGEDFVYDSFLALFYFVIVWANDVGAYLFGVSFGRHKLMERISPKKSWEGFFGGLLLAGVAGALAAHFMGRDTVVFVGFALLVALAGVAGDLVESMFKRAAGVKDSGAIMPGHGGWLDRFDATLASAPIAMLYILIFGI